MHSGILLGHKKNEMMPSAAIQLDLEKITPRKIIKRKTNIV